MVYPKPFRRTLLLQCSAFTAFWVFFPKLRQYPAGLLALAAFALSRTLAEGRRAIIFTEKEVIHRPPLGRPRRVLISRIEGLMRSNVIVSYMLRASRRPGVIMTLTNGEEEVWPLDFDERDEILRRLSAATDKAIQGTEPTPTISRISRR